MMNLTFSELKCPCCGELMQAGGASLGGRVDIVQKRCKGCDNGLMIVPMSKEYRYTVKALTEGEEKDEYFKEKRKQKTLDDIHDNMQYYMEYCQRNGYITPARWLTEQKHF